MTDQHNISELETKLGYEEQFKTLINRFDENYQIQLDSSYLSALKQMKLFLKEDRQFRYDLFMKTKLRGSDCLTIAILVAVLANKHKYEVKICRPKNVLNYFHAALVYEENWTQHTFKTTGRDRSIEPVLLTNENIMFRLKMSKPIVEFINTKIRRIY